MALMWGRERMYGSESYCCPSTDLQLRYRRYLNSWPYDLVSSPTCRAVRHQLQVKRWNPVPMISKRRIQLLWWVQMAKYRSHLTLSACFRSVSSRRDLPESHTAWQWKPGQQIGMSWAWWSQLMGCSVHIANEGLSPCLGARGANWKSCLTKTSPRGTWWCYPLLRRFCTIGQLRCPRLAFTPLVHRNGCHFKAWYWYTR